MGFRINGNSASDVYNYSQAAQIPAQSDAATTTAMAMNANSPQSVKPPRNFDVPKTISLEFKAGEKAEHVHLRVLREAVERAGLSGTAQGDAFITKYADSYSLKDLNTSKAGKVEVNLHKNQIADLRALQQDYVAKGGRLSHASLTKANVATTRTSGEGAAKSKAVYDRANAESRRMNDLIDEARIIPKVFGTPSKLRDLKHVTLDVDKNVTATDKDKILLDFIESRYSLARGGTLYGDSTGELLTIAKNRGIKLENITVENGKADFDISVENLLKLEHAFIGVQEKANVEKAVFDKASSDTVAQRFAKGLFEGAWADLKSNWEMVTDPIGTIKAMAKAVPPLANIGLKIAAMSQPERSLLFASLAEAGVKGLSEMPLPEAAEAAGKFVGALAVEVALGVGVAKSIGALSKTAVGKLIGAEAVALGRDIKQSIGNIPLPTGKVLIPVSNGLTLAMPKAETVKLADFVQMMKSGEGKLEMLENGRAAGRKIIRETAEEELSEVAQKGTKALKYELPKAVLAKVKEQLVTLNVARTETLARLEKLLSDGNLLQNTKGIVQKARNGVRDHALQDDLIGALRDKSGVPVRESGTGKVFDHLGEVNRDVLTPIKSAKRELLNELGRYTKGTAQYNRISRDIEAVSEMQRRINDFLEIK